MSLQGASPAIELELEGLAHPGPAPIASPSSPEGAASGGFYDGSTDGEGLSPRSDGGTFDPADPVSPVSEGRGKRRLRRRKLNMVNTLNAYEQRIRSLPQAEIEELYGKWLSSYDVWDTIEDENVVDEIDRRRNTHLDSNAFRLFRVAADRGVWVPGVTSERQSNGNYVAEIPVEGGRAASDILFVGSHNSFTKRQSSKWSIIPRDKRYEE